VAARGAQLRAALSNEGWTLDQQYAESTPAMSQFAVRRLNALCVVSIGAAATTAPPAAAAPAVAPKPYRLEIRCTESVPPRA
jgi:hypothetical protein